ncbi:hypothetical protein ATY41_03940 [Leifsonia xyli subsp. xyli]|uniref:Uncharacterized protein n=1 Tax=Leifsonia xyli subsp. xyli TaxID=59736 RepID=A0A1E2SIW9_LEIXY|nr:Flp pilus assembly complex ATPase component TadA [Leifsonia xyli]ODA89806.1 hypothetical protein ATY41_03940 [Leifsonia xyli subsp. xyli]
MATISSRAVPKPPVLSPRPDAAPARPHGPPPAGLWRTYSPLTPYLMREGITDLFVTGSGELWTDDARSGLRRQDGWNADEAANRRLAVRLIAHGGRHIDEATPFIDVRLPGGVRVHTVVRKLHPSATIDSMADNTAATEQTEPADPPAAARPLWFLPVIIAYGVVVLAILVVAVVLIVNAFAPHTFNADGYVVIENTTCDSVPDGFQDIAPGTDVTVKDPAGKTVAFAQLKTRKDITGAIPS